MPKGLLDHDSPPVIVALLHEPVFRKLLHNRSKEVRSDRQVIEEVLVSRVILIELGETIFDLYVEIVVVEIAGNIVEEALEPLPNIAVDTIAAIVRDRLVHLLAKVLVRQLRACDAKHRELARKQSGASQIVERRNQHASREITSSAENHHHTGIALLADTRRSCLGLFRYLSHAFLSNS